MPKGKTARYATNFSSNRNEGNPRVLKTRTTLEGRPRLGAGGRMAHTSLTAKEMAERIAAAKRAKGEIPVKVPGLRGDVWVRKPKGKKTTTITFDNHTFKVNSLGKVTEVRK